ncbi:MAG: hypothetical protein SGILL_002689 [Bacillariaceae sp.]
MRYEQKKTVNSLAREQYLNNRHHPSPPAQDDELSFMDDTDHQPQELCAEVSLRRQMLSEVVGTYILVLMGGGAAFVSMYGGISGGKEQGSIVTATPFMWTVGAMLGIYSAASISGGHLNPAITLAFCIVRPSAFSPAKVLPYWTAQLVGATLASLTLVALFHQGIVDWENRNLGAIPSKCQTTMDSGSSLFVFGAKTHVKGCKVYDQLQLQGMSAFASLWSQLETSDSANVWHAIFVEAFGTAFVVFVIFSVTSSSYPIPGPAVPPVVALALGATTYLLSPFSGDHLNPANEVGRRLVGTLWLVWGRGLNLNTLYSFWLMMWGNALPYVVGPMLGGPLGAWVAEAIQPVY